ncbi:(4Fe-4S) protein, partial [Streptomyces viridochromogenes]
MSDKKGRASALDEGRWSGDGRAFVGMPSFPKAARAAVGDTTLRANLRHATHTIRDKRARAVAELDDWAELREAGKEIKDDVLRNLDT